MRRYWATYLVVAGLVFAVGLTAVLQAPIKYLSSTRLMVSIEGSTTSAAYQNEEVATRRVNTYIPLITSGVVTQHVIDKLGLHMSPTELADKIDVANVPPKTSLIDVEVTDDSPSRARQIADTLANEFISYAAAVETPTGEDNHKVHTTVVTAASDGRENRLEPVLLGVLAAIAALLLGAVAVWIRAARGRGARERGALTAEQEHPAVQEDTDTVGTADETSSIQTNGSAPPNSALAAEDQVEATEAVEATERY